VLLPDWEIRQGDVLKALAKLPDGSVDCCVTSPPYWGLRDYGMRGQIGLEKTPELYIERMVQVFREVRRVLSDRGTCWINIGDSYATGAGKVGQRPGGGKQGAAWKGAMTQPNRLPQIGLKAKDLVGIPWMLAFALRADGWYLRSEIIWHKPNPMPESVRDRPTKSHEQIFLLTKSQTYHYDADAIKEPASGVNPKANGPNSRMEIDRDPQHAKRPRHKQNPSFSAAVKDTVDFRNKRSVWTVATAPYKGAHFATFPPKLIEPCILAGCPLGGVVLDPFAGAGTTGLVALRHGRKFLGIELNAEYCALANARIVQDQKHVRTATEA
jgi:DNA modification methylase